MAQIPQICALVYTWKKSVVNGKILAAKDWKTFDA
jgi:hypothetical protein